MRKPSPNPQAKRKLLDSAQELMLLKGFAATSLDEICKKAKLTKGTFFHYFKSKEELGKVLLERFCCSSRESMQQCCCRKETENDPLKHIFAYIDFAIEMSKKDTSGKGCLLGTFAQELSDTHPQIRSQCAKSFDAWEKILLKDFVEAKKKFRPRAAFDAKRLAEYFIAIFEGSQILAKAKEDKKIVGRNLVTFRNYLHALFKED